MAKYHISKSGKPVKCTARFKACPRGGSESHGETKEEAQVKFEINMGKTHPIKSVKKKNMSKGAAEKIFDEKTWYNPQHQNENVVKISEVLEAAKILKLSNAPLRSELGEKENQATVFYNEEISIENKVSMGFEKNDKVDVFVDLTMNPADVWMKPGVRVNGEKNYSNVLRFDANNGESNKKILEIAKYESSRLSNSKNIKSRLTKEPSDYSTYMHDASKWTPAHSESIVRD
jgi:hypothetical protein